MVFYLNLFVSTTHEVMQYCVLRQMQAEWLSVPDQIGSANDACVLLMPI